MGKLKKEFDDIWYSNENNKEAVWQFIKRNYVSKREYNKVKEISQLRLDQRNFWRYEAKRERNKSLKLQTENGEGII